MWSFKKCGSKNLKQKHANDDNLKLGRMFLLKLTEKTVATHNLYRFASNVILFMDTKTHRLCVA